MCEQSKLEKNTNIEETTVQISPWYTLFKLAGPFRSRILAIISLAALSTGASLIEPLIYRVAVNDVTGLFVGKAQEQTEQPEEVGIGSVQQKDSSEASLQQVGYQSRESQATPRQKAGSTEREKSVTQNTMSPIVAGMSHRAHLNRRSIHLSGQLR